MNCNVDNVLFIKSGAGCELYWLTTGLINGLWAYNPLHTNYIRFYIFLLAHYMSAFKHDINQQDLKIVNLHFGAFPRKKNRAWYFWKVRCQCCEPLMPKSRTLETRGSRDFRGYAPWIFFTKVLKWCIFKGSWTYNYIQFIYLFSAFSQRCAVIKQCGVAPWIRALVKALHLV